MKIVDIFPTPIGLFQVPYDFIKYIKYLENPSHRKDDPRQSKTFGTRSLNSYILDLPELKEFNKYLSGKIREYAIEYLNMQPRNYKITQSWISHKNPNQYHQTHTHPNSIISGVFYWTKYGDEIPEIVFTRTMVSNTWTLQPQSLSDYTGKNETFSNEVSLTLNPGTIILFPSYLPHSVMENGTAEVRKSLAFNSISIGNLGNEDNLTEFKYNI